MSGPVRVGGAVVLVVAVFVFIAWMVSPQTRLFWAEVRSGGSGERRGIQPGDPVLKATLPVPDLTANLEPSPLNALLKPGLSPQEQTDIVGQLLLDYWTNLHSLPVGTWEETCAALAGANSKKLSFVARDHPALSPDGFRSGAAEPAIRFHVISSSGGVFQLIYDGTDRKPYTDDDLIRNFPPDLDF